MTVGERILAYIFETTIKCHYLVWQEWLMNQKRTKEKEEEQIRRCVSEIV